MHSCRIAIVGLGLMGGSLGLAVKRFIPGTWVTGVDLMPSLVKKALLRGAVDEGTTTLSTGVNHAEIVFLATPALAVPAILKKLRKLIQPFTLVTDLASTKVEICQAAKKYLPGQFIGGHPMAGSEIQGIQGADPFLFENAFYLLTPENPRNPKIKNLAGILEKLGASVLVVSPRIHDQVAAYVSHLPQLLAVALAHLVCKKSVKEPLYRDLAAGGFRDMTRIASSSYDIWRDIFQTNSTRIEPAVDSLMDLLLQLKKNLKKKRLEIFFKSASAFRKNLPLKRKGFLAPLHRITVMALDRPGVLARMTKILAKEQINIHDIELLKIREGFGGTFQLYFTRPEDARKAALKLRQLGYETHLLD